MSYAESLNSGKIGQSLTKSMDNIKLSSEVSPAEVQSMLYKYGKNQKQIQPQSQVLNQTQPQTQNTPQIQPQAQADSFTMNNTPKAQNIQTYQAQPNYTNYQVQPNYQNYQPASYQAPLYNQPAQTQYQTPPNAQNVPTQYQNYQMTNSYPLVQTANNYAASTNAVNAYSAQNQPSTDGQNLNVTTQNQAV